MQKDCILYICDTAVNRPRRSPADFCFSVWECKPEPPKIPSSQLQPRHDRIQVDDLSVATEGVVPIQMDMESVSNSELNEVARATGPERPSTLGSRLAYPPMDLPGGAYTLQQGTPSKRTLGPKGSPDRAHRLGTERLGYTLVLRTAGSDLSSATRRGLPPTAWGGPLP
jgi:hypothetical protein